MGYYLETPEPYGKAQAIVSGKLLVPVTADPGNPLEKFNPETTWEQYAVPYQAQIVPHLPAWEDIPEDKALVVVVDDGPFEAAGVAYDKREYDAFSRNLNDRRPRTYILMDRQVALRASGAPA